MRTRVYIASPYSLGDVEVNVRASMDIWDQLLTAGYIPFCPLWSHQQHAYRPRPYEDWLAYDFEWVAVCHAVLRLPGDSRGADAEVSLARSLGLPVFGSIPALQAGLPPEGR
jgi:hypothetical protein